MNRREWYTGGLRFSCTQCGNCCTGPPGFVWCTDQEAAAIAQHLGISLAVFLERHTDEVCGRRSLNEHRTKHGLDCTFLVRKDDGRALCGIYPVRPQQCRTWPFWKENLESEEAWEQTKAMCPGSGKGQLYPIEQIRILRDSTPDL